MQTGITRVEVDGERHPLANSTNLQNRNRRLGILEIDIAILLEAFFFYQNSKSDFMKNFTEPLGDTLSGIEDNEHQQTNIFD